MKTKFKKTAPKENGWYWVTYKGKHGKVLCPAYFHKLNPFDGPNWSCQTAWNDTFGSWKQEDLRFGPEISIPS